MTYNEHKMRYTIYHQKVVKGGTQITSVFGLFAGCLLPEAERHSCIISFRDPVLLRS
ncbi:uncharacterized protein BDV14DRAFT_181809 [Aspergillus stella-maris]|uniref:uncharacterized protein n=1 Tax=Aspergillus stella-maris TaxID=1810926 RepID=UPI003CCCDA3E